jgi:GTPase
LLERSNSGTLEHKFTMTHPQTPIVALVGRPNVGKSTLFNRLTKSRKALVDATPGVTRDRHYERVELEGKSFVLVDTGGIETGSKDRIAGLIQEQTWQAIEEANIILFMLDGRQGLTTEDYGVIESLRKSNKVLHYLINKVDGPEKEAELLSPFYELGIEPIWPVSSSHGYGLRDFLDHLLASLPGPATPPLEEAETEAMALGAMDGEATDSELSDSELMEEEGTDTVALALIGRPNVGKSSLVNRLLGEERMMVSEIPGTTRDSVNSLLERDGRKYLLIDTAGIRRKGRVQEKIEKFSVMRALKAIEQCDINLILIDAQEGITEQDTKVIGYSLEQGRACLLLVNKWDLIREDKKQQKKIMEEVDRLTRFVGFAPVFPISALTGHGVKRLFTTLDKVYQQYSQKFSTGKINRILRAAIEAHPPSLHQGKRLKLYYTTQVGTKPPTFIVFCNYPKGVHFSYHRFLVNRFREGLGLDLSPVKIIIKERQRR